MTQVAGLQTVDAEGNVIGTLSVDDLTNLVANNLVKSTQNQIAAARSVSTMSEASTLAASDDYENTLPIDANPASVRTLDADGNPKQTGISALAQVVGELLPTVSPENKGVVDKINIGIFSGPVGKWVHENYLLIGKCATSGGSVPLIIVCTNYRGGFALYVANFMLNQSGVRIKRVFEYSMSAEFYFKNDGTFYLGKGKELMCRVVSAPPMNYFKLELTDVIELPEGTTLIEFI